MDYWGENMTLKNVDFNHVKDSWIISNVLSKRARESPNSQALQWENDTPITYKELYQQTLRVSGGLKEIGVEKQEKVLIMLPNCLEILYSWFSINFLGAIEVPINVHYKGNFLIHEANDCQAKVAIIHEQFLPRFYEVADQLKYVKKIIVVGAFPEINMNPEWELIQWETLADSEPIKQPQRMKYFDTGAIMYTSGTTGLSKGVIMPYGLEGVFAQAIIDIGQLNSNDVYYVCLPLFHANAQFMQVLPALIVGARVSIWSSFSASKWLKQVREVGATVTNTLGVMCEFIYRQPVQENDHINPLRIVFALPTPKDIGEDFENRFAVKCVEGYGMTETSVFTYRRAEEPLKLGSAGRPLDWYEVAVFNPETDERVHPGEIGEIVVRPKYPGIMMKGYHNVAEKTIEAWRNLWFHTGDLGRIDDEGYLYFVDRLKDAIRRRGENISSQTIESVINSHPKIKESAAIAVKSEYGAGAEDEVKVFVVLQFDKELTHEELYSYCEKNMPYFAVPRFIEFVESLPKTPNEKLKKGVLRDKGHSSTTWDREKHSLKLKK